MFQGFNKSAIMYYKAIRKENNKKVYQDNDYCTYEYEYTYHLVCLNNSYYPKIYADIFCMDFCCNSPLPGRKGVSKNEIF